jgi:hypothetical protein
MSDKPPGAYDTGGSGFDATRAADTSAAAPQEAAGRPPSAGGIDVPPAAGPAPAAPVDASTAVPQAAWDRAVGAWIDAHVRSSPIAQSGDAWAHLNAVLPRLRTLLEQELKT